MNATSTLPLVTNAFVSFGTDLTLILGIFIGIGIGYLIFVWGWKKIRQIENINRWRWANKNYRNEDSW